MNENKTTPRVLFKDEPRIKKESEPANYAMASQKFLTSFIGLASKNFSDAIQVHSKKPYSEITSLSELSLNVDKLLDCQWSASGAQCVRFAVASVYNTHYTAQVLRRNLISELETQGYIKVVKEIDCYAPCIPKSALLGSTCTSLDDENKGLLTQMILNYRGW